MTFKPLLSIVCLLAVAKAQFNWSKIARGYYPGSTEYKGNDNQDNGFQGYVTGTEGANKGLDGYESVANANNRYGFDSIYGNPNPYIDRDYLAYRKGYRRNGINIGYYDASDVLKKNNDKYNYYAGPEFHDAFKVAYQQPATTAYSKNGGSQEGTYYSGYKPKPAKRSYQTGYAKTTSYNPKPVTNNYQTSYTQNYNPKPVETKYNVHSAQAGSYNTKPVANNYQTSYSQTYNPKPVEKKYNVGYSNSESYNPKPVEKKYNVGYSNSESYNSKPVKNSYQTSHSQTYNPKPVQKKYQVGYSKSSSYHEKPADQNYRVAYSSDDNTQKPAEKTYLAPNQYGDNSRTVSYGDNSGTESYDNKQHDNGYQKPSNDQYEKAAENKYYEERYSNFDKYDRSKPYIRKVLAENADPTKKQYGRVSHDDYKPRYNVFRYGYYRNH